MIGLALIAVAALSVATVIGSVLFLRIRPTSGIVRILAVLATGAVGASVVLILQLDLVDDAFEAAAVPFVLLGITVLAIGAATVAASRS